MTDDFFQHPVAPEHPKTSVLAVDDDHDVHFTLGNYLQQQRYSYSSASSGDEMLKRIKEEKPDIILLDVMLPGKDGVALISDVRAMTKAPIILFSGSSSENTKIAGLEMGADDFMTKPIEMRELTARIKAILRRGSSDEMDDHATPPKAKRINFGGWALDRQQYQVFNSQGKSADLTLGEYRLLEALVMSPECVLSREQLYELTRAGGLDSCERAIDAQIARIRKKLQYVKPSRQLIKTIRKVGYMFCGKAEVEAT